MTWHACPCANCAPQRNEDDTSMILRRSVEKLPNEKPTVRPVGNYALAFEWTNGCSSEFIGSKEFGDWGKSWILIMVKHTSMVHGKIIFCYQ